MENNLSPASVATEARARGDQLSGEIRPEPNASAPAIQDTRHPTAAQKLFGEFWRAS